MGRIRHLFRLLVATINDLARVLWVCRVSCFSALLGFALLVLVPQVRDLFIDVPWGRGWWGYLAIWLHAAKVAVSVFFFWAFPVFFVALKAVNDGHWIARYARAVKGYGGAGVGMLNLRFSRLVDAVPRWLGVSCFISIGAGILLVYVDLYDPGAVTAANDAKLQLQAHLVATGIAGLAFWAAANWRVKIYGALFGGMKVPPLQQWQPALVAQRVKPAAALDVLDWLRILSFTLLSACVIAIFWAPQGRLGLERATLLPLVLGGWVPVVGWLARKSYAARLPLVALALLAIIAPQVLVAGQNIIRLVPSKVTLPESEPKPGQQWYLHDALLEWAKHNDCELSHPEIAKAREAALEPTKGKTGQCPPPVIVAAAGGASRAAFITAGAIGTLLDATCVNAPGGNVLGCAERPIFAKRLFAISGVSGGSLGGAIVAAGFGAAAEKQRGLQAGTFAPPCDPETPGLAGLWFRSTAARTWRDCLEAIVSGDFLSSTAMGLAFRDPIPFLRWLFSDGMDRAALLERSWSSRFDAVVTEKGGAYFERPFASFGPRPNDWRPLLIFNGTSALTGRRILTSHLRPNHSLNVGDTAKEFRIFQDAYDIRELHEKLPQRCDRFIGDEGAFDVAAPFKNRDFSLATAATNSARFPLISPSGAITCTIQNAGLLTQMWRSLFGGDVEVVDYVVDGGYFENFGATTAMNLARALETFGLQPIVLLISNNPMAGAAAESMLADACPPLLPNVAEDSWLGKIARPAGALYQTRDARGTYAIRDLVWSLRTPKSRGIGCTASSGDEGRPVYHVTVFGELGADGQSKSVSMSWWLSKAVQQFIDYQIPDVRENPVPLKTSTLGILRGRLANIRNLFELCQAIGAAEACRKFFAGLPLTTKEQEDYINDKTREWAENLAREHGR